MLFCTVGTQFAGHLYEIDGKSRSVRAEYQRDPRNVVRWRFQPTLGAPVSVMAFMLQAACRKFLVQSGFTPEDVDFCDMPDSAPDTDLNDN